MFLSFCAIFHDGFKYINGKSSRQETYVPLSANKTSRNGYKPLLFKTDSPLLMIHGSYQEGPTRQLNEKYRASYRSRAQTITTLQFLVETVEDLKQL